MRVNIGKTVLENPFLVSSGPYSETIRSIEKAFKIGFGGVVAKTSLLEKEYQQIFPGIPPSVPVFFKIDRDRIYAIDTFAPIPLEKFIPRLAEIRRRYGKPIFISAVALKPKSFLKIGKMIEEYGLDGIELNFSCPVPSLLMKKAAGGFSVYYDTKLFLDSVKYAKKNDITVGVKIPPSLPLSLQAAYLAVKSKVDFITFGNLLAFHPIPSENPFVKIIPGAGVGGRPLKEEILASISYSSVIVDYRKTAIMVSGGVLSGRDAYHYYLFGVRAFQITSMLALKGYSYFPKLLKEFNEIVDNKKDLLGSIYRGKAKSVESFIKTGKKSFEDVKIKINLEKCNGCSICEDTCPRSAIEIRNGKAYILGEYCEKCMLCYHRCPVNAVEIQGIEKVFSNVLSSTEEKILRLPVFGKLLARIYLGKGVE